MITNSQTLRFSKTKSHTNINMAEVCPITQEEIRHEIVLRGGRFELVAILEIIRVQGTQAQHPYERTPFTDEELKTIYVNALHLEPAYLIEQGWMLPSGFFAHSKEITGETQQEQQQRIRCRVYEFSVMWLVLVVLALSTVIFYR